jgi:hypothetical protein
MTQLDDLFGGPEYDHPKLRLWIARLDAGETATVEVRRPWDGIMRQRPELIVKFYSPSGELLASDSAPWEPGLNTALIARGGRAPTLFDEAERLAVGLGTLFEPLARRYGDDYFNSVLIELMRDMGMTSRAEVEVVMSEITSYPPHRSPHRDECRDDIKSTFSKVAKEQAGMLGYSRGEALDILVAALAEYLDDRFSVTSRRTLGWAGPSPGFWSLVAKLAPSYPGATQQMQWTAAPGDIATYLRSNGFDTTSVTVEHELLEHAEQDSSFPWRVILDSKSRRLIFEPKT